MNQSVILNEFSGAPKQARQSTETEEAVGSDGHAYWVTTNEPLMQRLQDCQ